jgi:O-acetyl-ADP-ribose deacetylase (regulator of RNase III)
MKWFLKYGDLLDEPADVLVCSANVFLNLSGGVGGAFLLRYGGEMQEELRRYLRDCQRTFVQPGAVIRMPPCGSPYKAVLHAVAVDAFYQSTPEVVREVMTKSLHTAAELEAGRVALAAVATGYGRLSMQDFAEALGPLTDTDIAPLREVLVCLRNRHDVEELANYLPGLTVI